MALYQNLYRDSKGRIRNADEITPENQQRLYDGKPVEIKPVFVEIKTVRKKDKKTGKFRYEKTVKYKDSSGKYASETDYKRFNYLRNISPTAKEIITTRQVEQFNVIAEITKAIQRGNSVIYKGRKNTPQELINIMKEIREYLSVNSDDVIIFEIEEFENGDLRIFEIGSINEDADE